MLSEADIWELILASNAPNQTETKQNIFCYIQTPDRPQLLCEAYCCDKQMELVHFSFYSGPTSPTSQIAVLIKFRQLQGSTAFFDWFVFVVVVVASDKSSNPVKNSWNEDRDCSEIWVI